MKEIKVFTNDELMFIFELAYSACKDAELLDNLTENMDLPDAQMTAMRDKLVEFMQA